MKIYLAGKIHVECSDWRDGLVRSDVLRDPGFAQSSSWPVVNGAVCGGHDLTGPYFCTAKHDCEHGAFSGRWNGIENPDRLALARRCRDAIDRSDLLFAWLDDTSAHGTLVEIGYAAGRGVPVAIGYPANEESFNTPAEAMWFACQFAYVGTPAYAARDALEFAIHSGVPRRAGGAAATVEAPREPLGFVYFIQRGERGDIKIGYSDKPGRRLSALQTGSPEPLHLLATLPGDMALERELHRRFAAHRLNGEWFRPAAEIFTFVAEQLAKRATAASRPASRPTPRAPTEATRLMTREEIAAAARKAREDLQRSREARDQLAEQRAQARVNLLELTVPGRR